jgi:DNA invertase Pin-like site-specific DNA recombinase
MRIGYARVSTEDQTIDLQKDALKRARCRETYEEHATGKNTARPQLEACLKSLREGDTFVVWRLDRLGRNLADLIRLIAELETRRIDFESLTEKIETRSPAGKLVFHVFAALAEFERNLIRERTVAGLKAARARGRKGGRPTKLSAKEIKTIRALLKTADIPVAEIAARFESPGLPCTAPSSILQPDPPPTIEVPTAKRLSAETLPFAVRADLAGGSSWTS